MFCTDEEFLLLKEAGNANILNELLLRVYNKAIEQALCHIPDVVNKLSKKVKNVNIALDAYFKKNPTFLDHKDIVMQTMQALEMEFTGMLFEDILEKATPIIEKKILVIKGGM